MRRAHAANWRLKLEAASHLFKRDGNARKRDVVDGVREGCSAPLRMR
jgi:hypothetical protein